MRLIVTIFNMKIRNESSCYFLQIQHMLYFFSEACELFMDNAHHRMMHTCKLYVASHILDKEIFTSHILQHFPRAIYVKQGSILTALSFLIRSQIKIHEIQKNSFLLLTSLSHRCQSALLQKYLECIFLRSFRGLFS